MSTATVHALRLVGHWRRRRRYTEATCSCGTFSSGIVRSQARATARWRRHAERARPGRGPNISRQVCTPLAELPELLR